MVVCLQTLTERFDDAGFSNTGFAREPQCLAFALAGELPPLSQQIDLFFAADQLG